MNDIFQLPIEKNICPHCGGINLQRYGRTKSGLQKYRCMAPECRRQFIVGSNHSIDPGDKTLVMKMLGEGISPKQIYATMSDGDTKKISLRWIQALKKRL